MTATFDVRFHAGRANWPANPFHFQGKGQVVVEPDFVLVRGSTHRSFRFPARAEHRLRMVDIVNAYCEGEDVYFHVLGVRENLGAYWISSTYKEAIAFVLLLLFLAVRPEGLLPERTADRA